MLKGLGLAEVTGVSRDLGWLKGWDWLQGLWPAGSTGACRRQWGLLKGLGFAEGAGASKDLGLLKGMDWLQGLRPAESIGVVDLRRRGAWG